VDPIHDLGALDEPRPEYRMLEIGARLVERPNRIAARHRASSEPLDLRKDEPHPVRDLASGEELGARTLECAALGFDEPLQIERIGHAVMLADGAARL